MKTNIKIILVFLYHWSERPCEDDGLSISRADEEWEMGKRLEATQRLEEVNGRSVGCWLGILTFFKSFS